MKCVVGSVANCGIISCVVLCVCLLVAPMRASSETMETYTLQWGDSKRPDGTTRHWNPQPLIDLQATLVCVAYRPLTEGNKGERWFSVGMTPPKVLAKALVNTKPELDECHKHGIKVIGYADTIMFHPEMLAADGINADDLYAIDRKGERVINKMWDKSGAGVACITNPTWIKLQKEVAMVTARAGFDGLQFDVYPPAIDPGYLCCCQYCKAEWSKLSAKLFGSPQPMPGLDSGKLDYRRPADRALRAWRLQEFTDFVKTVERHVQKSYPGFIIIMNHGGGTPDFTYEAAHGALKLPSTELWHLKLGDDPSYYIYTSAEAADTGKTIGLINFGDQIKPSYRYRVGLAEAYAGGGTFYMVTGRRRALTITEAIPDSDLPTISFDYSQFFRKHQDWYNDTQPAAEVAVLYSWRDQAFLEGDPVAEAKVEFDPKRDHYQRASSLLSRMGVAHDCLLVEKGFTKRNLARYRVIVAPDLALVTDKEATLLERYVRAGGQLLVIGDLGSYTEAGQDFVKRDKSLLASWTGAAAAGSGSAKLGSGTIAWAPRSSVYETAGGQAASVDPADVVAQLQKTEASSAGASGPALSQDFRSACESVALSSQIKVAAASQIETAVRSKGDARSIHLIRFGDTRELKDRAVTVDYKLPKGCTAKEVSVWSPDYAALKFKPETIGDRLHVEIDRLENYALVGVVLQKGK